MTNAPPVLAPALAAFAGDYDVILSDVWGVVHNGMTAWPQAGAALARFRAGGGTVVMISNAPRPNPGIMRQLDGFGVPREAYDAIVSSGDVTRSAIAERPGQTVLHIGPPRDYALFDGLDAPRVTAQEAEYVVCSGLFDDDHETPDDYADTLAVLHGRGLPMICANPDIVVERGDRLLYCAGAIADRYRDLGGEVTYAGKPHRPIYERALARAGELRGGAVDRGRVLAIGDSIRTDLTGARDLGVDSLFLTAGIHAEELGGRDDPDMATLGRLFAAAGVSPRAVMRALAW